MFDVVMGTIVPTFSTLAEPAPPPPTIYAIRVRETGAKRHRLLADGRLTDKWVHAVQIEGLDKAREHAQWLLDNNRGPDGLDSAQIVEFDGARVVETLRP